MYFHIALKKEKNKFVISHVVVAVTEFPQCTELAGNAKLSAIIFVFFEIIIDKLLFFK